VIETVNFTLRLTPMKSYAIISALLVNILMSQSQALTLVSELRTPCFLIDMDMLGRACQVSERTANGTSLYLPKYDAEFIPHSMQSTAIGARSSDPTQRSSDYCFLKYNVDDYRDFQSALGYIHASVTKPRSQDGFFLAKLDVPYDVGFKGRLVLGINNHHVGSYYWARSAGMGASMEAPGIAFRPSSNFSSESVSCGILCWDGDRGPLDCNSNDGKRSEWVNFLRKGDTLQLLPDCFQECLLEFWKRSSKASAGDVNRTSSCCCDRYGIYGFSSQGRPLGSEPIVTCKWEMNKTIE
jgi:hypothetical protein